MALDRRPVRPPRIVVPHRRLLPLLACAIAIAGWPGSATPPAGAAGCPVISGYVYVDSNNNGLFDSGEPVIPGSPIELRNGAGTVVGSTTTNSSGFYQFANDSAARPPEESVVHTISFPTATTDWSVTRSLPQFDPALGTLTAVDLAGSATITSGIKAESLDSDATVLWATVSGSVILALPGGRTLAEAPAVDVGSFDASAFDGVADFAGPSGHDFGSHSATDSNSLVVTGAGLPAYVGTGTVSLTASTAASSRTSGGGNVLNQINTTAGGQATLTYRYLPLVCLKPGDYSILQTAQPAGYADGRETAGNVTPLPNSSGTDRITVQLRTSDLPNNNFGELGASLSGFVYVDYSNDGLRNASEPPIAGVRVALSGTDAASASVSRTTTTATDGSYRFDDLLAGTYEVLETQPAGWLDGKDTIGSQGGSVANDRLHAIRLPAGVHGIENNFGELPNPALTPTPPGTVIPGTLTPQPPGTGTTGPFRSPTASETVAGAKTPGPPSAGSGLLGFPTTPANVALFAVVLISLSSWLAIIAMGRINRSHRRTGITAGRMIRLPRSCPGAPPGK